jgi:hypothetical protein
MPHIALPESVPGIRGPMMFRPETAKPLNELADILLHGPHTLTPGERELIATFVSPAMTVTTARRYTAQSPPTIWVAMKLWWLPSSVTTNMPPSPKSSRP